MRTGRKSTARSPLDPNTIDKITAWSRTLGGKWFCRALRERLWSYRGRKDLPLELAKQPSDKEWDDIFDLFGSSARRKNGVFDLCQADRVLRESGLRIGLRRMLIEVDGSILTRRGQSRFDLMVKRHNVLTLRRALLTEMAGISELSTEYRLLDEVTNEYGYIVPPDSASRTTSWLTYESAIRVAVLYHRRASANMKIPEKGLPATALGGSKVWTDASKVAFQNLIGRPFDQAVEVNDQPVQLRGPLSWQVAEVTVAEALPAQPWISLPLRALLTEGAMRAQPAGLLLVENHTNFEQVCKHSTVHDRWLVVWLAGFSSHQKARLVRRFPDVPVAAWCDMDPAGIEIIRDLTCKTGRSITPVGMSAGLWRGARKLDESEEKREAHRRDAAKMRTTTPTALLPLLECFIETGECVEQEELSVYDDVLPSLPDSLRDLECVGSRPGLTSVS